MRHFDDLAARGGDVAGYVGLSGGVMDGWSESGLALTGRRRRESVDGVGRHLVWFVNVFKSIGIKYSEMDGSMSRMDDGES